MNLLPHMALPPGVTAMATALADGGHDALLVGGSVRDALTGRVSVDFDVVTDAPPERVRALATGVRGLGTIYELGERFGTLGVALPGAARLEITLFRPDALAAHSLSLAERFAIDASHRDFTVNAMAVDLTNGALLDPAGGREDLASGVLRAPGEAAHRFDEDPLRVVRAARFVAELGLSLDPGTASAMPTVVPRLAAVAAERVREELTKLLVAEHVVAGIEVLRASGALAAVLPEVAALDGVTQPSFHDLHVLAHTAQTVSLAPATPVMRWAALLHDVGKAPTRTVEEDGRIRFFRHAEVSARIAEQVCRRLRMSNADIGAIVHLVAEHMRLGDVNVDNPRSVDRAVRKLDLPVVSADPPRLLVTAEDAVALTLADFGATARREEAPRVRERLERAVLQSRERGTHAPPVSPLSGAELMAALGIPEGPRVGTAKRAIEDAIESGALGSGDRDGAMAVARAALGYELQESDSRKKGLLDE